MKAVDYIKSNININKVTELLENSGSKNLRKLGDTYRGTCPIHGGNNDTSFSYNPEKNLWACFTECGGGDIFTLVAILYDIDIDTHFKEVVSKTAEVLEININGMTFENHTEDYKKEMKSWLQYALKREEIFNQPYDLKKLGTRYALKSYRGIEESLLRQFGIGYLKEMNRFIFPIFDSSGEAIGASLRANGDMKPKWVHRPKSIKTGQVLYNLNNCIGRFRAVYVVEGMMDCIRLISIGIENVVATFGAKLTDEQKMLFLKNFDEVILCFDNDKAGETATRKSIQKLKKIMDVKVLEINEKFKDIGEIMSIEEFNDNTKEVEWYKWTKLKETQ